MHRRIVRSPVKTRSKGYLDEVNTVIGTLSGVYRDSSGAISTETTNRVRDGSFSALR